MKNKILIILVGILSFVGISIVKADTINYTYSHGNNNSNSDLIFNNIDILSTLYSTLYSYYEENYSNDYSYYSVYLNYGFSNPGNEFFMEMIFNVWSSIPTLSDNSSCVTTFAYYYHVDHYVSNSSQSGLSDLNPPYYMSHLYLNSNLFDSSSSYQFFHPCYFYSNFDLINDTGNTYVISNYLFNNSSFTISNNDIIPNLYDSLNLSFISSDIFTEVDLNNYSYIALSLKDYNQTEEFYTTSYVKGQYCLTPVYNYGLTEKKDVLDGSKNQACSLYYDEFTPVRTYILESDLENHAIYYLKAYDTSKENKVKIDTSVFDIHYITSEEESNPMITIDGHTYSAIPYNSLTDSATISESEGYVSGASCVIGDFNCTRAVLGSSFSWSDIFTSPLNFLKDIWTSITQVFQVIIMFISLLPQSLQYFLYLSFMLAIILGLIKIIL